MKTRILTIVLASAALLFTSCDRSGVFEKDSYYNEIPYNFCVAVVSDDNRTVPVSGAKVEIFASEADRTAGKVFLSGTTDAKGEALFAAEQFLIPGKTIEDCKGNYYLKVSKGELVAEATTLYLLFNSGTTYQWVQLK